MDMPRDILLVEAQPGTARLLLQVFQDSIPDVLVKYAATSSEAFDVQFRTGPFTHRIHQSFLHSS